MAAASKFSFRYLMRRVPGAGKIRSAFQHLGGSPAESLRLRKHASACAAAGCARPLLSHAGRTPQAARLHWCACR